MKKYISYVTITALVFTLIASPLAGFAKEKENKGKGKSEVKTEISVNLKNNKKTDTDDTDEDRNEDRSVSSRFENRGPGKCVRAFGHLIAPGWLKKNGNSDIDISNCWLPFGIAKKFRGNNASTTPDTTAPVISNLAFTPGKIQAEIRWSTNESADSTVFWSTHSSVDTSASSTHSKTNTRFVKNHTMVIGSLSADTTYYVIVRSRDAAGNTTLSTVGSFNTREGSTDTQVPVISGVVTSTGTTSIQVGWTTDENTTDRVYYSTTLPVLTSSTTAFVSNASSTKSHLVTITGLNSNTTYYLVAESTDAAGNVTTSATFSAKTTFVADTTAPTLSSIAINMSSSTAAVTWLTNEPATSKVFYGTTTPIDTASSSVATNTTLTESHSMTISGLSTSTPYFFKIQSIDASNNTQTSSEFTGTTLGL